MTSSLRRRAFHAFVGAYMLFLAGFTAYAVFADSARLPGVWRVAIPYFVGMFTPWFLLFGFSFVWEALRPKFSKAADSEEGEES